MTIEPGHLYQVSIPDRGSGTVKAIRQCSDGMIDATIMHGRFKVRMVPGKLRIDDDLICFCIHDKDVKVKPIELEGK